MKRETVKASVHPRRGNRRWISIGAAGVIVLAAGLWFFAAKERAVGSKADTETLAATETRRFSPQSPVTRVDLETLGWEEINRLLQAVGADTGEIDRLIRLADGIPAEPTTYLRALLLILQQEPERALAAFAILEPKDIPPAFLYAPHRLQQTLRPGSPNPYLRALRKAIAEDKVSPLVQARVQASDGDLTEALRNYFRTDPGNWAHYDVESLRRIGTHQGLAPDLRRLIAGALASGRVPQPLVSPIQALASSGATPTDAGELERQLRHEIAAQTPGGKRAAESAKRLIRDRKLFVGRRYPELIAAHLDSDPIQLSTETVLLLFLSAVELKERIEMDRWGQELKRRHGEAEVRDWVNQTTGSAR